MELHGSHATQPFLVSSCVVEVYVLFNGIDQILFVCKLSQIVHFGFQDAPESFHRAIVDTSANSGHTLDHLCLIQFCAEDLAGVLETTVTVEQRMRIGILCNGFVECIKYQLVVVTEADLVCYDPSVIQVKNST